MSLTTLPNEILQMILEALYPPGFFSRYDWAPELDEEEDEEDDEVLEEDEDEEEDAEEEEDVEEGDMKEDEEDGETKEEKETQEQDAEEEKEVEEASESSLSPDTEDEDSESSHVPSEPTELKAWAQVTLADWTMINFTKVCPKFKAASDLLLLKYAKLAGDRIRKEFIASGWDAILVCHAEKLVDVGQVDRAWNAYSRVF